MCSGLITRNKKDPKYFLTKEEEEYWRKELGIEETPKRRVYLKIKYDN